MPKPAPEQDPEPSNEPVPGALSGDVTNAEIEAVAARLSVWCGPFGSRPFGRLLTNGQVTVIQQHGRLRAALLFDLGEADRG